MDSLVTSARRIVIKVGASVLTGGRGILSRAALRRLVNELATLHRAKKEVVLVSSGAIACGMEVLGKTTRPRLLPQLQAAAAIGQGKLMHLYEDHFSRHQIHTAQILLTRDGVRRRSRGYDNARHTLRELLRERVVPIINENDTIATQEISFGDNDGLSAFVARIVGADLLILLTDVPGFYVPNGRRRTLLSVVRGVNAWLYNHCYGFDGQKTVGGMKSKLNAAREATRCGIPMILADGGSRKTLRRLFGGEAVGTTFLPQRKG